MGDLVLVADVKTYMGLTGSGEDTVLGQIISGVSEGIQSTVGRALVTDTYRNEVHTVNDDRIAILFTDHRPLILPVASSSDVRPIVVTFNDQGFRFHDLDVSAGADTITEVGHGLATADGPFIFVSTGTLPAGLEERTSDYYAIRVDDDTIQVALTAAAASAGTQVDITGASGTGTHYLVGPNVADDDVEWDLDTGAVYRRLGAFWPRSFRRIKFAYQAGYGATGSLRADIEAATFKQVAYEHINTGSKGRLGRVSNILATGAGEQFLNRDWAPGVLDMLQGLRHVGFR